MEQTRSSKLVYSPELSPVVESLRAQRLETTCFEVPALDVLLSSHPETVPFTKSFADARTDPILVLHSSGSTGIPKPVVMTHGSFATLDNDRNFPTIPGRRNHDLTVWDFEGKNARIYEPFPPFHLAGFMNKIVVPLYTHTIPVFGPPLRPPSGALAAEIMKRQKIRGSILPPVIAEQLYHEQGGFDLLKQLDVLCFAGGPLSAAVGDELVKHTTLCQFYGSTEVGQVRQLVPQREDWSYLEFHPSSKFELQPADDAYELVIFADQETEGSLALNHNYPGIREWHTRDLFKPHPTKPNLWKFHARRDDIIVLSTGEKLNPIPFESFLTLSPDVSGALVVGQGHPHPVLLVELKPDHGLGDASLDSLWPSIEKANQVVPTYGRIMRSAVLVSDQGRPFVRAGKGTVIRQLTSALYAKEIEELYARKSDASSRRRPTLKATAFTGVAVKDLLRSLLNQTLPEVDVDDSGNLYVHGLDSLGTAEMVEALRDSLATERTISELEWLSIDVFYNNPSINQLTIVLLRFLNEGVIPERRYRAVELQTAIDMYTKDLRKPIASNKATGNAGGYAVAVTGTTGYMGSRLLLSLMKDPHVSQIYCLNRSTHARYQWEEQIRTQDFTVPNKALIFMQVNFAADSMGLPPSDYQDLVDNCDAIIHNAWTVNFNLSLASFQDNLKSVRDVVDLSLASPRRPHLIFISSITATGLWSRSPNSRLVVPEARIEDLNQATPIGYGESKLVAEHILEAAAETANLPVSILRVGQIAASTDPTDSKWPDLDLVPALFRTSRQLSLIPSDLERLDWIPVDKVVQVVLEIITNAISSPQASKAQYYNVVNPCVTAWSDIIPVVQEWCGGAAQVVPMSDWVRKLKSQEGLRAKDYDTWPALKMLRFFELMGERGPWATWDTQQAEAASTTLATLKPIGAEMMHQWLESL